MAELELEKWKTESSKYLVDDRWLKLRADTCITPDGHTIEPYYVLELTDWVNCFVVDENLDIVMVNHYRHGVDKYLPELVSGMVDPEDSSPEVGMRRELEEELGYIGGKIYQTGVSYPNAANHTNKVYSFLALGGSCVQEQKLEKGESLQIMKMPFKDFLDRMENRNSDTIYQTTHLTAIFFALNFIRQSDAPELQEFKKLL